MVRHRLPLNSCLEGHWVITGASHGIGAALARAVRRRWPAARISLVDVDEGPARALAVELGGADAFCVDLTQLALLPSLLERLRAAHGPIDVLVNNAGVMWVGEATEFGAERTAALLGLDLMAPIRLAQLVGAEMRSRGVGAVVNVASLAGVAPLRGCSVYCAAKAGIANFSETLRVELLPHGINVLTVYPGPVRTRLEQEARRGLKSTWASQVAPVGSADGLVEELCGALEQGKARVIYPRSYELAWRFPRLASWVTARFSPPTQATVDVATSHSPVAPPRVPIAPRTAGQGPARRWRTPDTPG